MYYFGSRFLDLSLNYDLNSLNLLYSTMMKPDSVTNWSILPDSQLSDLMYYIASRYVSSVLLTATYCVVEWRIEVE